jgi:DNA replication protein DnaC
MEILGIQDLGAEPAESLYMGNRAHVLRQILEYRGDFSDKLTLITSNLPINHQLFADRYHVRVSSRLNEMCNYFEIRGKDRRERVNG